MRAPAAQCKLVSISPALTAGSEQHKLPPSALSCGFFGMVNNQSITFGSSAVRGARMLRTPFSIHQWQKSDTAHCPSFSRVPKWHFRTQEFTFLSRGSFYTGSQILVQVALPEILAANYLQINHLHERCVSPWALQRSECTWVITVKNTSISSKKKNRKIYTWMFSELKCYTALLRAT